MTRDKLIEMVYNYFNDVIYNAEQLEVPPYSSEYNVQSIDKIITDIIVRQLVGHSDVADYEIQQRIIEAFSWSEQMIGLILIQKETDPFNAEEFLEHTKEELIMRYKYSTHVYSRIDDWIQEAITTIILNRKCNLKEATGIWFTTKIYKIVSLLIDELQHRIEREEILTTEGQ